MTSWNPPPPLVLTHRKGWSLVDLYVGPGKGGHYCVGPGKRGHYCVGAGKGGHYCVIGMTGYKRNLKKIPNKFDIKNDCVDSPCEKYRFG